MIDEAMTTAAEAYVNDPRGVHFDDKDRLRLSKIYAWFREDFGGDPPAVLQSVARYAMPPLRARLEGRQRIDRYAYDWSLNDSSSAAAPVTARRPPSSWDGHARQDASLANDLSVASAASLQARRHRQ